MDECNWDVGITAFRCGHTVEGCERSVTQEEYRHALELQRAGPYSRVFVLLASDEDDFRNDVAIFERRDRPEKLPVEKLESYRRLHEFREERTGRLGLR